MNGEVLGSWKEIAAYLGKGVRTVQRWEQELALPVRRPNNHGRIVLADRDELDQWLRCSANRTHVLQMQVEIAELRIRVAHLEQENEALRTALSKVAQNVPENSRKRAFATRGTQRRSQSAA